MSENQTLDINLLASSYTYILPEEMIATVPAEPRDTSKLMLINRTEDKIDHKKFRDIIDYLVEGDLIVLNDTRVIPARLHGRKKNTKHYQNDEGALVEVFLVREISKDTWLTLAKPGKRLKKGTEIIFNGSLTGKVENIMETGERIIHFIYPENNSFMDIIKKIGEIPFPPYITKPECEDERYQTVYSKKEGSVAAPTAGLHFTDDLMKKLKEKGIKITYLTLHVGLGTFLPLKTENIKDHKMHEEYYEISSETANILNQQKNENKRIIAVGTTVTRTLETVFSKYSEFKECNGFSDIFIYPGYQFKAIDALITNFHLPESTLLMLVSAFWDRKKILNAYEIAKEKNYHFYSLGDSMFMY